ncbi:uncharacterized protein CC84DRAFT_1253934 [Paraphaeosphaeria sporulosa]|uniref:Uncharacterized protein n=1 Tax=Paraphaeosphaeria sporulosa TaxID=1460663 RepID=A0A177CXC2_9PLEO|nr:uncharacterized protein CC84DRAFT_1253934 [Paraphaeosphaeria sporulosa]OAG11477.1 hypothetical protein CC84DRAFT_1253934 [Paraphaeosphaeria sporulosa]
MDEHPNLATSEIRSLRNQTAILQDKLDRSLAKIMTLQSGIDQVTDGEVKKRFEGVFSSIQNWVTEIELDLVRQSRDFRDDFQEVLRQEEKEPVLLSLGLRAYGEDKSSRSMWEFASMGHLDTRWVGTLDTCINVVLSRFMWQRLYHRVFYSPYPIGLNVYAQDGIDYIFQAIEDGDDGESKVEAEAILRANKWRAESMATIVSTTRFRKDKDAEMQYLLEDLWDDLTRRLPVIDTATLKRHMDSLSNHVVGPAVELKQTISCSSVEYCSVEPEHEILENARDGDRFWEFTFKDIVEWRDKDPFETYGGLFRLFPGIRRRGMKDTEDVVLVKPTLLVLNRQTIGMLQEFRESNAWTQHRRQGSPGKTGTGPSRQASLPPSSSRSSTTKTKSDRRTSHRKQDESYPETSGLSRIVRRLTPKTKSFGHEKKLEDLAFDTRPRLHRRGTEDNEMRESPPRETRGKDKRSRRTPTPASSRKPSLVQPYLEAMIPPGQSSEPLPELPSQPIPRESPQENYGEYSTHLNDDTDIHGSLTQRPEGEETERSDTDSSVDILSNLEAEGGNSAQQTRAGPKELVRSPGLTAPGLHPNHTAWRRLQAKLPPTL